MAIGIAVVQADLNQGPSYLATALSDFFTASGPLTILNMQLIRRPTTTETRVAVEITYNDSCGVNYEAIAFESSGGLSASDNANIYFAANPDFRVVQVLDASRELRLSQIIDALIVVGNDDFLQGGHIERPGNQTQLLVTPVANIAAGASGAAYLLNASGIMSASTITVTNISASTWASGTAGWAVADPLTVACYIGYPSPLTGTLPPITTAGIKVSTLQLSPLHVDFGIVQRLSDLATMTIPMLGGQRDDATLTAFASGGATRLLRWYSDPSDPNAIDMVQTNVAVAPWTTDAAGVPIVDANGYPAVLFDGDLIGQAQRLESEFNMGSSDSKTILLVAQISDLGNDSQQSNGSSNGNHWYEVQFGSRDNNIDVEMPGTTDETTDVNTYPDATPLCIGFAPGVSGTGPYPIYRNGASLVIAAPGDGGTWGGASRKMRLGSGQFASLGAGLRGGSVVNEFFVSEGQYAGIQFLTAARGAAFGQ